MGDMWAELEKYDVFTSLNLAKIEGQMYNMIQSQKDKNYQRNNKRKEGLIFTSES